MANKVTIVVEVYQLRFVHESSSKGGALSNVSAATAEGILICIFKLFCRFFSGSQSDVRED